MVKEKVMRISTGETLEIEIQTFKEKERNLRWIKVMQSRTEHSKLVGSFTFTLLTTVKELIKDIRFSEDEKTRLMFLGTYVNYAGDTYSRLQKRNGKPVLKKNLQSLLMMSNNKRFYAFYNKLVKYKIMLEVEGGELYWNSNYHFKGRPKQTDKKAKNLIKLYDSQLRELYLMKDERGKQKYRPSNLFVLFVFLPFVNYETNLLSEDADKPASETRPFLLSEVANRLGYSRSSSLKRKLKGIKLYNAPVFSIISESNNEYIRVNPYIIWRNSEDPSPAITETFKATEDMLIKKKQA